MALDRRELSPDPVTAFLAGLDGRQATIWTAMPATVLSFDPEAVTASLQVTVQAQAIDQKGAVSWLTLPPLLDCPVFFPGGQGLSLTFPLSPGDEVLVVFASRCIDNWWQQGGIQTQAELRMHDLSDGFCFPAVLSQPQAAARAPVSMDAAELRNADGTSKVRLLLNGDIEAETGGNLSAQAAVASITATTINLTGNVVLSGTFTVNGVDVGEDHTHGGVVTGGNNTGGVTP